MRGGELVEVLEKWSGAGQCWVHPEMRISPEAMAATVHSYIAPCHTPSEVAAQVDTARREERREEREACAKVADSEKRNVDWYPTNPPMSVAAHNIADAIRARGDV
jgi:hypothetical protein